VYTLTDAFIFTVQFDTFIKKYYKLFDHIDNQTYTYDSIVTSYIEGITWVINYYDNSYNIQESYNNANSWFYHHSYAPLCTHIYEFLANNPLYLNKINLNQYNVPRKHFYNGLEHFLFVSPIFESRYISPFVIDTVMNHYSNVYKLIESYLQQLLQGKTDIISCSYSAYINKCTLKFLHLFYTIKDQDFITFCRTIVIPKRFKELTLIHNVPTYIHI
jgi:hypothetical protein